jgi:hypothetical protein
MAIVHESELATGCDWCSCGRIAAAESKCSVGRSVVGVSTDGFCLNLNWRPVLTGARGRIAAAACKCSVGRSVVGVSTDGDCAQI